MKLTKGMVFHFLTSINLDERKDYSKTSHSENSFFIWSPLDSECERIFSVPTVCNDLVNVNVERKRRLNKLDSRSDWRHYRATDSLHDVIQWKERKKRRRRERMKKILKQILLFIPGNFSITTILAGSNHIGVSFRIVVICSIFIRAGQLRQPAPGTIKSTPTQILVETNWFWFDSTQNYFLYRTD